jgi:hypothetical protein
VILSRDQVIELLQLAAAGDKRTIGEADVAMWSDAARIGRWAVRVFDRESGEWAWTNQVALDAIRNHFARATTYLLPGHITEYVAAWRRQPQPVSEAVAHLEAAPPASEETRERAMEQIRRFAEKFKPPEDAA